MPTNPVGYCRPPLNHDTLRPPPLGCYISLGDARVSAGGVPGGSMAEQRSQRMSLQEAANGIGSTIDYMFGRNSLIGIASLMLLCISGYATWSGMNDFIVGVSQGSQGRQIVGGLTITNSMLVIAIVIALTFLMWLCLRESFGAKRRLTDRLVTFPLYVFLALWSIGFGYGFWWSLIAGEEATRNSMAGLSEDARDATTAIAARLDAVKVELDNVVSWSDSQMNREDTSGGSCGLPSGAGRGPLYAARRSVRDSITTLRDGVVKSWLEPVQADLEKLKSTAAKVGGGTVEERQKAFENQADEIRSGARSIAARSNELGSSTAGQMSAIADAVSVAPGQPGFSCSDPTLAERLRQAAAQAGKPAELHLRQAAFNEGPAGVANAVKNLWANFGNYFSGLVTYIGSGGQRGGSWTSGGDPITGRDLIALLATLGIDMGLFALTVLNPPRTPPPPKPSASLIRQIRSVIDTARARSKHKDLSWIAGHVVHHKRNAYLVIPNLYSCDPAKPDEQQDALAMNQLAGVLSDLGLVRWPRKSRFCWFNVGPVHLFEDELEKLRREETGTNYTDLTEIRREHVQKLEKAGRLSPDNLDQQKVLKAEPIRNHGLFSKARRALQIAGWSERAQNDFEVFVLTDSEGLTPLLAVLNEVAADQDTAPTEQAATAQAA